MGTLAIISALAKFAPDIAKWIGGDKAEQAAEAVSNVVKQVTGTSDLKSGVDVISRDPAAQAKFTQELNRHKEQFNKLFIEDKANARAMQVEVLKNGKGRFAREFIYWYAAVMTVLACFYIGAITFLPIPANNVRFADTSLGFVLGTVLAGIVQFFYGASKPVREDE